MVPCLATAVRTKHGVMTIPGHMCSCQWRCVKVFTIIHHYNQQSLGTINETIINHQLAINQQWIRHQSTIISLIELVIVG